MEKKLIVLVFIALLAGLGGGYGLGYVIYQPQMQKLQSIINTLDSKVTSLDSTVEKMENRTWHEAYFIQASSDVTTNTFLIKGEWIRIRWYMLGGYYSWIIINILYSNGTSYTDRGSSGIYSSYACDLEIIDPNTEYYLEIATYNVTEYFVVVWDYY